MTTIQQTKLVMYMVIRSWLKTNENLVKNLPSYLVNFTKLDNGINSIQATAVLQQLGKSGASDNKKSLKETLVAIAYDISRKLVAFANNTKNLILLNEVDYSLTDLRQSMESTLVTKSQGLYDRADANLTSLAEYEIDAELMASFLSAIGAFNAAIPSTKDGPNSTIRLAELFKEVDLVLDNLDKIIEIVRSTQSAFYENYIIKRRVPESSNGVISLKGIVLDTTGNVGISGVTIKIMNEGMNGSNPVLIKKSALKGGFYIKMLPAGMYKLIASKNGYTEKTVTAAINDGEMTSVEIKMQLAAV